MKGHKVFKKSKDEKYLVKHKPMIKKLDWDSSFFGYEIGRLDHKDKKFEVSDIKGLENYDLVYVCSKNKLKNENLTRCYPKIIFQLDLNSEKKNFSLIDNISELCARPVNTRNKDRLFDLAFQSGVYSRFKLDVKFTNNEFNRLYEKWVENSIRGEIADQVLVNRNGVDSINAFVSIQHEGLKSTIGLIAVDKEYRGKGIGTKLMEGCKFFAQQRNSKYITVATQKENIKACNFYKANGFEEKEIVYIYHLWNK